jgi:hypothetical protein
MSKGQETGKGGQVGRGKAVEGWRVDVAGSRLAVGS